MDNRSSLNRSSIWRRAVTAGYAASPALTALGFIMAADLVFCMLGLVVDRRIITGAPAWLKPAKFAVSTMIAAWSFAFCIAAASYLGLFGLVLWQAFRGQSIAQPDSVTLESFAAWLVVTAVAVFVIHSNPSTKPSRANSIFKSKEGIS